MRIHLRSKAILGLFAAALLLGLAGCTTDSPTEPRQGPPAGDGGGGAGSGTWNITVSSSRSELEVNSTRSALITVSVRDAATNGLPPNGAIITVAASTGEFGTLGSGDSSVLLQLLQGVAQVLYFAGDEVTTAIIQARLENSVGQTTIRIVEPTVPSETPVPDVFFLERVEPDEGRPEGGEVVRILGQEISEPVRVFFGGLPAEVLSVTANTIRVRTPRNDSVPPPPAIGRLTVDVEVTINANQADEESDILVSGFTYTRGGTGDLQPIIFSVTPNLGPNEGGTRVVINGDGFESPVQVTFEEGSTVVEADVESISRTQIVVISPAAVGFGAGLKDQSVDVRVRNLQNGLEATRTEAFRYGIAFQIFGVDPVSGPPGGGTQVTIFGEGFDEPLVVDFGSTRQQVTSVTGNQILVRTVPVQVEGCLAAGGGPVTVTHLESNASVTQGSFEYVVIRPEITGTNPATIPQSGGVVRILGRNFELPLTVTFDGRAVTVTSVSSNEIVATFPAVPNGSLTVDACDANGDGFEGERFVVTLLELSLEDDQGCTDTFEVNVNPSDTTCRNDAAPTPTPLPMPTPTATPTP